MTTFAPRAPHPAYRVLDLRFGLDEPEPALRARACEVAGIDPCRLVGFRIAKRSVDARRVGGKRRVRFVVHADLMVDAHPSSAVFSRALASGRVRPVPEPGRFEVDDAAPRSRGSHAIVVGAGPGGLFAALALARNGVRVDVLDRGAPIERRGRDVVRFHRGRAPDPESNLLFGEGGAGTYSDGKLYTRVDDPLELPCLDALVASGAPEDIRYDSRAHIGTDRLHRMLPVLRAMLEREGVRFHFRARVDRVLVQGSAPRRAVAVETPSGPIACDAVFLAPGHSARDTWHALARDGFVFEPKPFQIGVRIEHPQALVDRGRYGDPSTCARLGPAYYNLTWRSRSGGASAHSFCMCPGGKIVSSVNVAGLLCTNGMSNSSHSSPWANAAVVTTVGPELFGTRPFDGVTYQATLERRFFEAGGGDYTAPAQRADHFLERRETADPRRSSYTFGTCSGRIDRLLPSEISEPLASALRAFDRSIPGFAGPEGILVGLESRSSGPVRMVRGRDDRTAVGFSNVYPVGEGAGYAGGIMSAAIDGARSARAYVSRGP